MARDQHGGTAGRRDDGASGTLTVGRLFGFPLRLHWSWPIALALIAWSLQASYLPDVYPEWSDERRWAIGVVTAVLFFGSVLAHELAHARVARARGHAVESITLFVFGGVSAIATEARNARDEFWIAIVGPLSSVALAVLLAGVWLGTRAAGLDAVYPLAGYLAYVNVTVAVFNLLPGFPLDGGRVLRALLWGARGDELSATRIASRVGRALAGGMIGGGLLLALGGAGVGAIWLVFIGWILWSAAESTYRQRLVQLSLTGVRAGDLADQHVAWVTPDTTLRDLVTERALRHGTRTFMVAAVTGGDVLGLVSLTDLARFPEAQWGATSVFRAMTPRAQLVTIEASTEALEALRLMVERDVNQLPVFSGGSLVGLLTRAALLQAIDVRARFGAGQGRQSG